MGDENSFNLHSFLVLENLIVVKQETIKQKICIKNLEE